MLVYLDDQLVVVVDVDEGVIVDLDDHQVAVVDVDEGVPSRHSLSPKFLHCAPPLSFKMGMMQIK